MPITQPVVVDELDPTATDVRDGILKNARLFTRLTDPGIYMFIKDVPWNALVPIRLRPLLPDRSMDESEVQPKKA